MNTTLAAEIIRNAILDYSDNLYWIVVSVVGVIVAFFVLRQGIRYFTDQSFSLGGFYMRKTPYKGYNRFRSREWNLQNTLK